MPFLHTSIRLLNPFTLNGNNKSIYFLPSINTLCKQLKVFFTLCSRNLIIRSSTNFFSLCMFYVPFARNYNVFVAINMYVYAMSVNMAIEWILPVNFSKYHRIISINKNSVDFYLQFMDLKIFTLIQRSFSRN